MYFVYLWTVWEKGLAYWVMGLLSRSVGVYALEQGIQVSVILLEMMGLEFVSVSAESGEDDQ